MRKNRLIHPLLNLWHYHKALGRVPTNANARGHMRNVVNIAVLVIIALVDFSIQADAADAAKKPKISEVELLQQIDELEKANDAVDQAMLAVDRLTKKKYSDCLKVSGDQIFCRC